MISKSCSFFSGPFWPVAAVFCFAWASARATGAFSITDIETVPGNQVRLEWESTGGASYRVESALTLDGPWQAVSPLLTGAGARTEWEHDPENQTRFYRIVRLGGAVESEWFIVPGFSCVEPDETVSLEVVAADYTAPPRVSWSASGGNIVATGDHTAVFTAPSGTGAFTITATNAGNLENTAETAVEVGDCDAAQFQFHTPMTEGEHNSQFTIAYLNMQTGDPNDMIHLMGYSEVTLDSVQDGDATGSLRGTLAGIDMPRQLDYISTNPQACEDYELPDAPSYAVCAQIEGIHTASATGWIDGRPAGFRFELSGGQSHTSREGIDIVEYQWRFSDGATAAGEDIVQVFPGAPYRFLVELTVTDSRGNSASTGLAIMLTTVSSEFRTPYNPDGSEEMCLPHGFPPWMPPGLCHGAFQLSGAMQAGFEASVVGSGIPPDTEDPRFPSGEHWINLWTQGGME